MKKVLMITGDGVEMHELYYPYWRLKEAGIEVTVAAPTKKEALFTVIHDVEEKWETYTEKIGYRFRMVDCALADIRPEDYDGLVLPGGRAPEYLRLIPEIEPIVRHFIENEKPVGAICHGVLLLSTFRLVGGRMMTTYRAVSPDLIQSGARYRDDEVVVDGNLVTSRTFYDLPAFMREYLKVLRP
jgi:protease I